MLIREAPKKAVHAIVATLVGPTCSTGYDSVSGTALNGIVHDLESLDHGGVRYRVGTVAAQAWSTLGSTGADTRFSMAVKIQHGDSSGGGDMTDYSTAFIPAARLFGTTAMTTAMGSYSTGLFAGGGPHNAWDLRAAKKYIRAVLTPTINEQATATAITGFWRRVSASLVLSAPDDFPEGTRRGAFTTATATAT